FIATVDEIDLPEAVQQQVELALSPAAAKHSRTGLWIGKRALLDAVAVILIGGLAGATYVIQKRRERAQFLSSVTLPQTAGKRSVAVMFFDNQSGSPDLDWLREGLAD